MSNPFKGEARLGETRLQLDINAICELEELGESFDAVAARAEAGSMRALRLVIWALMLRHAPETSLREAGDLISEHGPDAVGAVLARLFAAQAAAEEPEGNAPAPQVPGG